MEAGQNKRGREPEEAAARVCNYVCCDEGCRYRTDSLFNLKRHFHKQHWEKGSRYPTKFTEAEYRECFHGDARCWPHQMTMAFRARGEDANASANEETDDDDDAEAELERAVGLRGRNQAANLENDGDVDEDPPPQNARVDTARLIDRRARAVVDLAECPVGAKKNEKCHLKKSGFTKRQLLLDASNSRAIQFQMLKCMKHANTRFSEEQGVNWETDIAVEWAGEMRTVLRVTQRVLATVPHMILTANAFNEQANMKAAYRISMLSFLNDPPCQRTAQHIATTAAKIAHYVFDSAEKMAEFTLEQRRELRTFGVDFTFQTAPIVTFEGTTQKHAFVIGTAVSKAGFPLDFTVAASESSPSVRELVVAALKYIEESADLPEGFAGRRHANISIDNWHQYGRIVAEAARGVGWTCEVHQDWFHFLQRICRVCRARHSDKHPMLREFREIRKKHEGGASAGEVIKLIRELFSKYQKTVSEDPNHGKLLHEFEMVQALVSCLRNPTADIKLMVATGSGVLQTVAAHKWFERNGFCGEAEPTTTQIRFVEALLNGSTLQNERLHATMKQRLPTKGTNSLDLLWMKIDLVCMTKRLGYLKGLPDSNALDEAARAMCNFNVEFSSQFAREFVEPHRVGNVLIDRLYFTLHRHGPLDETERDLVLTALEVFSTDPASIRMKSKSICQAISHEVFQGARTPAQIAKFVREQFALILAPTPNIEKEIAACAMWLGKTPRPKAGDAEPAETSDDDELADAEEAEEMPTQNPLANRRAVEVRPRIPEGGLGAPAHVLSYNKVNPVRPLGQKLSIEEAVKAAKCAHAVALPDGFIVFVKNVDRRIDERHGAWRDPKEGEHVTLPNAMGGGIAQRGVYIRGPIATREPDEFEIFDMPWRCEYFCYQQWFYREDISFVDENNRPMQEWFRGREVGGWPLPAGFSGELRQELGLPKKVEARQT